MMDLRKSGPMGAASLLLTLLVAPVDGAPANVSSAVLDAENHRIETIERISQSTIAVFGVGDAGGGGSAVVITTDGYALTNFHVTKPVGNHLKCGMNDGRLYDAVVVGIDPTGDVALIKLLDRDDFPAAELGDSDSLRVGDWCLVAGNPFLLATDFHPTITYGIISGVHRYQYPSGTLLEYTDCIQTDAAINPGNSGGPLFDADGRLVGINGRGSFEKRGRVNVGVGYAISINQIKNFMGYLHSGRIVDHATLGATVATDQDGNVVVTNILESSDAYRRGLRYGDELVAFGGRPISSTNGFKNALGIFPKGWRVPLSYRRNGQRHDVMVRLSGLHASEELIAKLQLGGIAPPRPREDRREKDPKDGEGDKKPPLPIPGHPPMPGMGKAQQPMPAKIAKLFAERRGYANYFFNQLQRDRIWQQFQTLGDWTAIRGTWQVQGELPDVGQVRLEIGDRTASGRMGEQWHSVDFDRDLSRQLAPRDSGGLLLALHQWRRLIVQGPEKFGEVYYLGTVPLVDHEGLVDALVATYDALETRFYFEPQRGTLLALEMYPDLDVDPCEIYFRWDSEAADQTMPTRLDVIFGEKRFGTLQIHAIDSSPATDGGVQ